MFKMPFERRDFLQISTRPDGRLGRSVAWTVSAGWVPRQAALRCEDAAWAARGDSHNNGRSLLRETKQNLARSSRDIDKEMVWTRPLTHDGAVEGAWPRQNLDFRDGLLLKEQHALSMLTTLRYHGDQSRWLPVLSRVPRGLRRRGKTSQVASLHPHAVLEMRCPNNSPVGRVFHRRLPRMPDVSSSAHRGVGASRQRHY